MRILEQEGIIELLAGWTDAEIRLKPDFDDLEYLYSLIRVKGSKKVLEFGVGYSTLVIAKALEKNREKWDGNPYPYKTDKNLFKLYVVEANANGRWLAGTMANVKDRTSTPISVTHCPVIMDKFNGRLCHRYSRLPNVMPDFVYLDGPDPQDVLADIGGLHFRHPEALPMSCDLLIIEPILLPGTTILVDGRTANARFLRNNFQRDWRMTWYKDRDVTLFELKEEPLFGNARVH